MKGVIVLFCSGLLLAGCGETESRVATRDLVSRVMRHDAYGDWSELRAEINAAPIPEVDRSRVLSLTYIASGAPEIRRGNETEVRRHYERLVAAATDIAPDYAP